MPVPIRSSGSRVIRVLDGSNARIPFGIQSICVGVRFAREGDFVSVVSLVSPAPCVPISPANDGGAGCGCVQVQEGAAGHCRAARAQAAAGAGNRESVRHRHWRQCVVRLYPADHFPRSNSPRALPTNAVTLFVPCFVRGRWRNGIAWCSAREANVCGYRFWLLGGRLVRDTSSLLARVHMCVSCGRRAQLDSGALAFVMVSDNDGAGAVALVDDDVIFVAEGMDKNPLSKELIYPVDAPDEESERARELYLKSHMSFGPGAPRVRQLSARWRNAWSSSIGTPSSRGTSLRTVRTIR